MAPSEDGKQRKMLEVLALFRIVFKSVRKHYQNVERSAGISGAQLWALSVVASSPGCKVGEIAKRLSIHQSTASNLRGRLEQADLITGNRVGSDRREVRLYTTWKGRRILEKAPKPLVGVLQFGLSHLSARELTSLRRHLSRLTVAMNVERGRASVTPLSDI